MNPFMNEGGHGNLFVVGCRTGLSPFRGSGPGTLGMGCVSQPNNPPICTIPVNRSLRERSQVRYQDMIQFALLQHPNSEAGIAVYRT